MNLDEDKAASLFNDDRGDETTITDCTHWMTIERRDGGGVVIETDCERYELSASETEQMIDSCGWDSVWWAISENTKCLDYLRDTMS